MGFFFTKLKRSKEIRLCCCCTMREDEKNITVKILKKKEMKIEEADKVTM